MTWIQKLYETYNHISDKAHEFTNNPNHVLSPMWHSPQTAHIKIRLNEFGEFLSARVLPKNTIIHLPVTEKSEGRTRNVAPHALCDSLQYIAQDLGETYSEKVKVEIVGQNGKTKEEEVEQIKPIFNLYIKQLNEWCHHTQNKKVLAIQKYVQKGTVLADLIAAGVIPTDEQGKVLDNWTDKDKIKPVLFEILKKESGKYEIRKVLVAWEVEIPNDPILDVCSDISVQKSWSDYYQSTKELGVCSILLQKVPLRTNHPAKLTYSGDSAKLISSNDDKGFTFRGRCAAPNEVASISAEVSHKAHAALRWLIARQGIHNGDPVTVTWAISGARVPQVLSDMVMDELGDDELERLFAGDLTVSNEKPIENNSAIHDDPHGKAYEDDLGLSAAKLLKQKMNGCLKHLPEHETLSLLALDSATPGRMALTYYQEFLPADYFRHLNQWIDDFSWYQYVHLKNDQDQKGRWVNRLLPPLPYAIFETIYGKTADKEGKIKKQLYLRLLPVIAGGDKVQMPLDLVEQSIQAACKPTAYEAWEWRRNIGVACALYKGWRARHHDLSQRRTYSMSLDKNLRSRDYLYGRLLAVAENIESYALYLAGEPRSTNAERYMQRFAKQPCTTWRNIELALDPYQKRLQDNNRDTGKQAIDEIMELFEYADFTNDNPLSGEFLLGYHCQRMEIKRQVAALKSQKAEKSQS